MEALARKPSKPSSNVSDIVYRFAKVCRLRSLGLGVFSNETPSKKLQQGSECESTEETQWGELIEEKLVSRRNEDEEVVAVLMLKLFDTVSTLKLAYIQLQQSHFPYNPNNIQAADELIVSQLKTLCDIKKSYKKITKPKSTSSSLSGPLLLELIHDHAIQLENLQCQVEAKDVEILSLERDLEELDVENADLVEKIKQKSLEEANARFREGLTENALANAIKEASKAIHDFAKPLISLMKASSWDLDVAANSIENSLIYSKRSHKKYAFEAYISRRMFNEFCLQTHTHSNVEGDYTRYEDPLDALIEYPNSNFAKFCRLKYLLVVHPKMEMSFFGNLDQRNLVDQGGHPRTLFYQLFVKMAKWVWLLGASIDPKAEIFGIERGSEFSVDYMENVVEDEVVTHHHHHHHHHNSNLEEGARRLAVGLMVTPGFKIGCSVIKARVYLSRFLDST